MYVFKTQNELRAYLTDKQKIGFVPTMGALHDGHIQLIHQSTSENEYTGCSIFVNPTQFNNQHDFDKYPITHEKDMALLLKAGCDFLFLPVVDEMYPEGIKTQYSYDLGYIDTILEGSHRPGHFQGVCAIVHKLLLAVKPTHLYMGEKDFQQCMVVKRLLELTSMTVQLIICPTLRDEDGLAKSSRNTRLSSSARQQANGIYNCLKYIHDHYTTHSFDVLQHNCLEQLSTLGFTTEYIALADANNLTIMDTFDIDKKMVVLIAAVLEGVRLIDNMRLN
jgi:pantoate--beta-alanine ligase